MLRIDRVLEAAATLFRALANACLVFLLAANTANIVLRGFFGFSLGWVFPWSMVFMVWMVFFGFFGYVRAGRDIGVLFLVRRLPMGLRRIVAVVADLVTLGVTMIVLLTFPSLMEVQAGLMEMVDLDRRALSLPLFASCVLIVAQILLNIWAIASGARQPFATDHDKEAAATTGATT